MLFYFDYGDDWHFPMTLKNIIEPEPDKEYPCVLQSVGEAPEQYPEEEE